MPGQPKRGAVRGARAMQNIVAVLPTGQPAHRPDLSVGHHVHAAVRTAARRGQLQLRRLAVPERALLGREGRRHVDDDGAQRRQPARQPAGHTEEVAAHFLRHGHQPDTAAVAAIAAVAAVRHIRATAAAAAAAGRRRGRHRVSVRSVGGHAVRVPHQHRGNTLAGRFPKLARRVQRSRKRDRSE